MRKGQWTYSLPFALNIGHASDYVSSVVFQTPRITAVPVLAEFDKAQSDPSGFRHLTSHAAFSEILVSGEGPACAAYGHVDFSTVDISTGSGVSRTRVFLFRMAELDCCTTRVHNMKIWASNTDDFLTPQNAKIVWEKHNTWKGDYSLPSTHMGDKTKWLPTSLPTNQNLLRQDGKYTIHASGDADVSQWVYLAVASSGTMPLGQYGLTTASGFLMRVTYDLDNLSPLFD